jgi:amicyanin
MRNTKGLIIGVIVVITVAVVAVVLTSGKTEAPSDTTNSSTSSSSSSDTPSQSEDNSSVKDAVATNKVDIVDYAYSPKTITVKAGTTVTWTNQDSVKHDITSDTESADAPKSELLAKGESYSFTFTKPGTYTVHCTPHPYMHGIIVVTE